jgi:hypothetical protein
MTLYEYMITKYVEKMERLKKKTESKAPEKKPVKSYPHPRPRQ